MLSQPPPSKINLDKLFSVCAQPVSSPEQSKVKDDKQILDEAVSAIATNSRRATTIVKLYDPAVAKVSRLFANDTLGSWLVRAAGLIEDSEMCEAFDISMSIGVSPLEVLHKSGKLSHCDLNAVYQAEALVSEGLIYRGFAASALKLASSTYIDFSEALEFLDIHPKSPFSTSALVNLIQRINLVDEDSLLIARREALSKGITIGWSLVKNELIDEQLLKVIIESIFAIRDRRISEDELIATAILAMSSKHTEGSGSYSPESILVRELELTTLDRAFGNLLLASNIIGIEELLFCAEVACEEGCSLEEVVDQFQIVESQTLTGACQLARMLIGGKISARDCTVMLQKLKSTGKPLNELVNSQAVTVELSHIVQSGALAARTA